MHKKSKKQRQPLQFKRVQVTSIDKDLTSNNSASIIPLNEQSHEQDSMSYLSVQVNKVQSNLIKIKSTQKMTFEDEEEQQQESQQEKHLQDKGQNCNKKTEQLKQQQQQIQKRYIKETTSTYNESTSEIKKQKQQLTQKALSQQLKTQHYQYDGAEDEQYQSQQQQQQQEKQIKQKALKKVITIQKTFFASTFEDLIFGQIPPQCIIVCAVNFNHGFLSMKRSYDLYLVKDKKYLFSATKQRMKLTSHFKFYKNGKSSGQQNYFGELNSNFTGLQYIVNKINRNDGNRVSEQCWIGYDLNLLGLAHQRNFTVLKNLNSKLQKIPFFSQIKNYYENGFTSNFEKFINRKAIVNKFGDYQIDFHGKVNIPSSTNFILTNQKDQQSILFGKRNKTTYILEIGYPFSIFQGFSIAVSNLDHKLCVR